ncbi:MAG: DUF1015 domain-containing protein [bacterium]
MAKIIPFQGYKYNPEVVKDIPKAIAPLFDLISKEEQEQLYQINPYNMVRLNLGKLFPEDTDTNNRYTRSAKTLQEWIQQKVLIQSPAPSLYVYTMQLPGQPEPLIGFIGLVELQEFGSGQILPHENTLRAPVEDRVKLTTACKSYFDPIFGLFQENHGQVRGILKNWIEKREPEVWMRDETKTLHQFWTIDDQEIINLIRNSVLPDTTMIADGHHRYTAALQYRAEQMKLNPHHTGIEPYNYVIMFLADWDDPGLLIMPTHRLLKNLPKEKLDQIPSLFSDKFEISETAFPKDNREKQLESIVQHMRDIEKQDKIIFGLYAGKDKFYWLTYKGETDKTELNVSILNQKVFNDTLGITPQDVFSGDYLRYTKDSLDAVESVDAGKSQLAFILTPVKMEQVKQIVLRGDRMPQKSTYFVPKPKTGLVIYSF